MRDERRLIGVIVITDPHYLSTGRAPCGRMD